MRRKRNLATGKGRWIGATLLLVWMMSLWGCPETKDPLDAKLEEEIAEHNLRPLEPAPTVNKAKVELGQALFFDRVLSGNRDVSCATCHHPTHATGDGRELSAGVGGEGLGPDRVLAAGRELAPRNASPLFNLGDSAWRTQFWDGRVELFASGEIRNPAAGSLPAGLDNIAAVQAMFPVTSRDEMRGERGDVDIDGHPNEIADMFDSEHGKIWGKLMARLLEIPRYRELFAAAYPDLELEQLGFEHAANAIAAFEIEAFTLKKSPFDRYLAGEKDALSDDAKRGALLFFGEAGCGRCHGGALLTDQSFYNIAPPQLGPGKEPEEPLDNGRARVSMNPLDTHLFRTPSLHNVAETAPYMHSGAFHKLEDVILHHTNPEASYLAYDATSLDEPLRNTVLMDAQYREKMVASISPELDVVPELSAEQIQLLVLFLESLSSPELQNLERWIPEQSVSGLPID